MLLDHRLLHRMQPAIAAAEALDRDEFLAVQRGQELDAGIDGFQSKVVAFTIEFREHDRARTAVALGTTLFRTGPVQVLAKELQHRSRGIDVVKLHDLAIEHEADGLPRPGIPCEPRVHRTQLPRYVE